MKRTLFVFFCFFLSHLTLTAQLQFQWAKSFGGASSSTSEPNGVVVDANDNVYFGGTMGGTVDFDPGTGTYNLTAIGTGGQDIFMCKLNVNGGFVWAKKIGGSSQDHGTAVAMDGSNNLYIGGDFGGTVDFDPGAGVSNLTATGSTEAFIAKYDQDGNFIWVKKIAGTSSEEINSIDIDPDGNVIFTGRFIETVDFDPGAGTYNISSFFNSYDVFICKLDSNGNFVWARNVGGVGHDQGNSVKVDYLGNVYYTGYFLNNTDFDPGPGTFNISAVGASDIFVEKLDDNGNFVWAKSMGGTMDESGTAIDVDQNKNVYVAGFFYGSVDFDPGVGVNTIISNGQTDIFISKLDTTGNSLWTQRMGGASYDQASSIALGAFGDVHTTGSFTNTVDFDPGPGTYNLTGGIELFMSKLDSLNGNFIWAGSIDGGDAVITASTDGGMWTFGTYGSTVDFNPGPGQFNMSSISGSNMFGMKMQQCMNMSASIDTTVCDSYLSPSENHVWTSSGIYVDTLTNPVPGCDTCLYFITVNLTVNHSAPTTHLYVDTCDSYTFNAQTYTTSGTHSHSFFTSEGCDSIIVLHLTIGNNSSTLVTTECNSFTLNSQTYTNTGNYTQILTNSSGCDSTVYLNLTIDGNATLSQSGNTFTASLGDTYMWINCTNGNAIVPGANGQSYTATSSGSYAAIVTENACVDTTNCSSFVTAGIEDNQDDHLIVYPNPTTGNITIDFPKTDELIEINIHNSMGQKITSEQHILTDKVLLNISGPSGVYFIYIISTTDRYVSRIIKQ